MGVNFRYIDYGVKFSGLYSDREAQAEKNLYVFLDNRMKEIFFKRVSSRFLEPTPTLLTMEEFKDRIFYTDRIILKEAKRILAFFKCIPQSIKDELGIGNYYDIIDLANNFFAYYRELLINGVIKLEECSKWQERYLTNFETIKEAFDEMCREYNYLPSDWLESYENYSNNWIKDFTKIVFVDIVEFPKVYRDIIMKLGESVDVEIALQMRKGDFDEENLRLKKVKVPEKIKDIRVYTLKSDLEEALLLIHLKNQKKGEIYSPVPEKNSYSEIFPHYFAPSQKFTMNDTKLYKFLNIQLDLLNSQEERLGKTYFLFQMLSAFENRIFKEYYGISEEDFKSLNSCAIEGYKYISRKILQDSWFEKNFSIDLIEKLNRVIFDLESITDISNTNELYSYIKEQIKLERFIEENLDNEDIFDKFFEIFGIIKSNEVMKIHKSFDEYFGSKIGVSLYRLLIQYMKDLAVKSNLKYSQDIGIVKPLDFVRYSEEINEVNYFIDITDDNLPKRTGDNLILTEKQRKKMGIMTKEERREEDRYRFIQAIFNGKDAIVLTKKDETQGIDISPFLEEIILKNKIPLEDSPIKDGGIVEMLNNSFIGEELGYDRSVIEAFPKEIEDFRDGKLEIGAYDYGNLVDCPLRFYFMNIERLSYNTKYEDKDINTRILGIIVHKVLEEFVNSIWKRVLQEGVVEVRYEEILERMQGAFKAERAKIPLHMDNYCEYIMIPLISKNIVDFFRDLRSNYEGISIRRFQSEKSSYEKEPFYSGDIDVYLRGRADLVIESELGNEIIDYKTGSKKDGQLDYYTIILYGESGQAKKLVFNAWSGKIEREDKVILTRERLEEEIESFVKASEYMRAEKQSTCQMCEYYNICGRGRE
ncbi:PD-(D/E)XK nuclease family protein [Fusobacterium sp.]|uniref:PD-(D/E)XK nuclease family protein n=1 Tax=Fusobacterium sp. TaxID=68766 RepID=UPI0025B7BADF|nr:PD-(D/E)XK nuclease family protein [Fusobacterium sp.]